MNTKKLALITGASSGIGKATSFRLAKEGYDLILVARRKEMLDGLKKDLNQAFPLQKITVAVCDIQNKNEIKNLVNQNSLILENLNILINNAGLAKGVESFQNGHIEDWETMIDTNLKGVLFLTRELLPFLIKNQNAHIVNIGSVAGRWVYPGGAVYCATKFAIRAFTEGLRQDLCGSGVRVTNIEPGMVETEFSIVRLGNKEQADAVYQGMKPLSGDDIAETIYWSLSRPAHVNIQELVIFPTDQAAIRQVHRQP